MEKVLNVSLKHRADSKSSSSTKKNDDKLPTCAEWTGIVTNKSAKSPISPTISDMTSKRSKKSSPSNSSSGSSSITHLKSRNGSQSRSKSGRSGNESSSDKRSNDSADSVDASSSSGSSRNSRFRSTKKRSDGDANYRSKKRNSKNDKRGNDKGGDEVARNSGLRADSPINLGSRSRGRVLKCDNSDVDVQKKCDDSKSSRSGKSSRSTNSGSRSSSKQGSIGSSSKHEQNRALQVTPPPNSNVGFVSDSLAANVKAFRSRTDICISETEKGLKYKRVYQVENKGRREVNVREYDGDSVSEYHSAILDFRKHSPQDSSRIIKGLKCINFDV